MRKRSRSKGRCELSVEKEEKEVKIGGKLKAESADPDSFVFLLLFPGTLQIDEEI